MEDFPVYLFTGFLESGKTKFIQETLEDKRFNGGEKTLLLICEEGEEEYDSSRYSSKNIFPVTIDSESVITPDYLSSLADKYKAVRAVIEYNGMWNVSTLFSNLPESWAVYQDFLFADCNTFLQYNMNMRGLVVDKITYADIIVFNRCTDGFDKLTLHKIARAISRGIQIAYEYTDGHAENDDIEDPLPFDINAAVIVIKDEDYAIWYRDIMEDTEKYNGKTVHFKGIVAKNDKLPADRFVIGRHIMTCCVEDIQYCGMVCIWNGSSTLNLREWVEVTARIENKYIKSYGQKGPVLSAVKVIRAEAPEQDVATFY